MVREIDSEEANKHKNCPGKPDGMVYITKNERTTKVIRCDDTERLFVQTIGVLRQGGYSTKMKLPGSDVFASDVDYGQGYYRISRVIQTSDDI
jgi:hypothetical protein